MRTCDVGDCGRMHYGKGFCKLHYRRLLERGSLDLIGYRVPHRRSDPVARFWARVNKNGPTQPRMDSPCWVWTGARTANYGRFWNGKRVTGAHCFSFELVNGPIPEGMLVCHECDNPPCVNPVHLWLGDDSDNLLDAVAKGRWVAHNSKWTHCKWGHEFTAENTIIKRNGRRRCRNCSRKATREWMRRSRKVA